MVERWLDHHEQVCGVIDPCHRQPVLRPLDPRALVAGRRAFLKYIIISFDEFMTAGSGAQHRIASTHQHPMGLLGDACGHR